MKLQDFVQDKPILETGQLILRPLRKEDVVDFSALKKRNYSVYGLMFMYKILHRIKLWKKQASSVKDLSVRGKW